MREHQGNVQRALALNALRTPGESQVTESKLVDHAAGAAVAPGGASGGAGAAAVGAATGGAGGADAGGDSRDDDAVAYGQTATACRKPHRRSILVSYSWDHQHEIEELCRCLTGDAAGGVAASDTPSCYVFPLQTHLTAAST